MKNKSFFYFMDTTKLSLKYIPFLSILMGLTYLLAGLAPVLQIHFTAGFIGLAISAVNTGIVPDEIFLQLFFIILTITYIWLQESLGQLITEKAILQLRLKARTEIIDKCAKLDYRYIEDADSWNLIARVIKDFESNIFGGYTDFINLISVFINIAGVLIFIASASWYAALAIVIFVVPLIYFSIKSGKANYQVERQVSFMERRFNYLREILLDREYSEERTMFGYGEGINARFLEDYNESHKLRLKTEIKWQLKSRVGSILSALAGMVVIVILLGPTLAGNLSVGLYIAVIGGVFGLMGGVVWRLSENTDKLIKTGEFAQDIKELLALDETSGAFALPHNTVQIESIEFINVCFRYPGTDRYILKDFSLRMEKGKHYAFVGANGAGKTTAIKLLTGLYQDYEGEIKINSKDIGHYSEQERKGMFVAVYQDFAKYSFTLRENCAIGDMTGFSEEGMEKRVEKALGLVDMEDTVKTLPKGIDTNLGKIHQDGVDLSGGQWQRLAMARALISKAPVRIMDEPTAALDPVSESRIYELFDGISTGELNIFISHRLGSTKIADEIFVIDNGKVVEQGSFNELISLNGLYHEMFEQQRSWY